MAYETLLDNGAVPSAFLTAGAAVATEDAGDGDANIEPNEDWALSIPLTNAGGADATVIDAVLTTSTPGVVVVAGSSTYADLTPAASASNDTPYLFAVGPGATCGVTLDFTLTVTYSGGVAPSQSFDFSLVTGSPGTPVTFNFTGPPVAIPDGGDLTGSNPGAAVNADLPVAGVLGAVYDLDLSIDGATCTNAVGATTVGIDHSFVNDLEVVLRSPTGTTALVIDNTDGSGNNFCQTELDDQSAGPSIQSVVTPNAPFTGSFSPNAPLAGFNGEDPNGTWQLQVQDFFSFDTGNIREYSLTVTPAVCDAPALVTDVTATKVVSGGDLAPGGTVVYTVVLTNNGTGAQFDNPGDELTDTLPVGLTVLTPTATSGTVSGPGVNPVTWNGGIPAGGSVTVTIPATIDASLAGMTVLNQGQIASDVDRDGTNEAAGLTDDPAVGGATDPTAITIIDSVITIPTLSELGFALLASLLAGAALMVLRRRV